MDVITYQKTYREYKAELDNELQKTAEGFVRIGYLLKVARDTNVLAESGYKTVAEFAQAEYSLDKTQVSRFISINDRFSEGGYSDRLRASYQGFGYAKLTLMLQLPDAVNEMLTPAYSKAEIQSIKDEVDEEKKVSDIELCLETAGKNAAQKAEPELDFIGQVIYKLGHDTQELFTELYNDAFACSVNMQHFQRIMAPAGEKTYSVRLDRVGRVLLILNDSGGCRTVNTRTGEYENVTWQQLRDAWETLSDFKHCTGTATERWSELYGEPYTDAGTESEKTEVAPEQSEPKQEKKARKESKVSKAKTESQEKPLNLPTEAEKSATVEQIPVQTDIENDFPEMMPPQTHSENAEKPVNTECGGDKSVYKENNPVETVSRTEKEDRQSAEKTVIYRLLDEIRAAVTADHWGTAMVKEHNLKELIDKAAHGDTDEEVKAG